MPVPVSLLTKNPRAPLISWAWQHHLKISLFTTNHTSQGLKIGASDTWQNGRGKWSKKERQSGTSINSRKQTTAGPKIKCFLILQNTSTLNCSCFTLGAIVPYVSAILQAPHGERKDSEKKPAGLVVTPNIHYAQKQLTYPRDSNGGFKLVVKDPKRHLGLSFLPVTYRNRS